VLPKMQLGMLSTERGMSIFFKRRVLTLFISYWHRKFLFRVKRSENPEVLVSVRNLLRTGKEQMGIYLQLNFLASGKMEISKVKDSRNRPGVAQRVPGGLGSQISMTFGTCRWSGCQPHASAAVTPRNVPVTHFY